MGLPYSRKIWRFGGLYYNHQIKIRQNFLLAYIHMAMPYRTAKFKSANILLIAIWGSTAKFNAHQYFWLYGICMFPKDCGLNGPNIRLSSNSFDRYCSTTDGLSCADRRFLLEGVHLLLLSYPILNPSRIP